MYRFLSLTAFVIISSVARPAAFAEPPTPVNDAGLKLSIASISLDDDDAITLKLAFENLSNEDMVLNLGEMLANGKVQLPNEVRLTLTDGSGQTRELYFSDKRYPGVAGRVDDYILALRAGSVYSLALNMKNFWCPKSKEFSIGFSPQEYTVRASFTGQGARFLNSDTEGLKNMPFFTGTVHSDSTSFRVPKKG